MSEQRVGLIAITDGAVDTEDVRESLAQCGHNTGNLLFHYAVPRLIEAPVERFGWDSNPRVVREACDTLVIPEANAINPQRSYEARAAFLRDVDLPCIVLGLGAQAPAIGDRITLQPGTNEYLHELSTRSVTLGVRGEYTVDVLAGMGITNTVVTGCPSNLIDLDPSLPDRLKARSIGPLSRLQVGAGDMKRSLRRVERRLFEWSSSDNNRYVLQSGVGALLAGGLELSIDEEHKLLRHLGIRRGLRSDFIQRFRENAEIFFDAGSWLKTSSTFDISISSRIHSTICAIQAGVAAVIIRHDARTDELRRTHAIPSVGVKEAESFAHPHQLMEAAAPQWDVYGHTRIELAREILSMLGSASIRSNPSLVRFAKSGSGSQ